MPTSYDPNQPLLDPDIQQALEQGRQAQLAALLGQQRQSAAPRNLGEGIDALGKGFLQGVQNYMAGKNAAANNASMASALGGAQPMPFLGGASTMSPMSAAPAAGPPLASAVGAGPTAGDIAQDHAQDNQSTPMASNGALTPVQQQIADTWRAAGANDTAIAGILGNVQQESGFNPSLSHNKEGGGGLYQHLGDRYKGLLAYGDPSPAGQSEYSISELGGPAAAKLSIDKLNSAQSPQQAASMFMNGFERPAPGPTANESGRRSSAAKFAGMLGASQAPPAPSTDQIAANIGPAAHLVTPGMVAGPGVPSNLPMPPPRPMVTASAAPPPPPEEEEEAPAPGPQAVAPPQAPPGPSMLSPTPMGAPQGFVPPGAAPQAAAGAIPQSPVAPPPVAPPPSAVAGGGVPQQGPAPPGTHWAHLPGPPLLLAGDEGGGQAPQPQGGLLAQLFGGGQAQAQPQIRAPAPMAAGLAGPGGQAPPPPQPGGLAAGLSSQPQQQPTPSQQASALSGNQAVYQQMYQAAAGQAVRLQHAAALASASGNQGTAQIYEKQYEMAVAQMNKANDLAVAERTEKPQLFTRNDGSSYLGDPRTGQPVAQISPAKPMERPLTDQEATAYGIKDKAGYTMNPATGKPEQIAGTADKSDTTSIKEFEYGQAHPDFAKAPKWIPNAKTNDLGQPIGDWVSPPNPASKTGTAQQPPVAALTDEQKDLVGTPNDHPMPAVAGKPLQVPTLQLTDDQHAALNSIPDARRNMVQSILQRDMVAPPISARNPLPAMLRNDVLKVMPNFDFAAQPGQVKSKSEFLSGGPSSYSKQIEFGDTAVNHLLDYTGLSDKVPDSSEGILSKVIGGPMAQQLGTKASSFTNEGLTAQNALINKANTFSGELTKYLTGSEGTEADRNAKAAVLSPSLPVAARKAAVLDLMNTVEGRKSEIQAAWHNAVGPNVQDFPVISQHAQQSMDKIRAWATSGPGAVQVPGGQDVQAPPAGAPTPAGPVGAAMAPPRNVAPQITGAPPAPPAFNYDAIPKGQVYTGPDGKQRRKQ